MKPILLDHRSAKPSDLLSFKGVRQRFNFFPPGTPPSEIFHTWFALGALLLFLVIIITNLKTASLHSQKLTERNNALKKFEEKMTQLRNLEPELPAIKKDLPLLEKALPNNFEAPSFLNKLNLLFGKNRLTLTGIRWEKDTLPAGTTTWSLIVNLDFQGDYLGINQALANLERDEQQFDMQSLLLRRPYSGTKLEGSLRLRTYFYKEAEDN